MLIFVNQKSFSLSGADFNADFEPCPEIELFNLPAEAAANDGKYRFFFLENAVVVIKLRLDYVTA